MPQVQDTDQDHLDQARAEVARFFARTADLTASELTALSQEQRRSRSRLSTDPDFLQAVCSGAWTAGHADAARHIRQQARTQAAALVPWPRRASLATALEEAALAVLSQTDPSQPLPEDLCQRLHGPWERAIAGGLPRPRPATS